MVRGTLLERVMRRFAEPGQRQGLLAAAKLLASAPDNASLASLTWDECWKEYTIGGVERWLWFLVYFLGQADDSPLLKWAQFFHNQISEFLKDHQIGPNDVVQPRP